MKLAQRIERTALAAQALSRLAWERLTTGVLYLPGAGRNLRDPYALYRRLRVHDPIHRTRVVGGWVLTRYADCVAVLRDPRFSADDRNLSRFAQIQRRLERWGIVEQDRERAPTMLRSDPPVHTRLRGLVSKAFTPRAVEKLRPRVSEIVEGLLDAVEGRERIDLIRDLAYPLPVIVIAEMLGVPPEDRERFKHWSDEAVASLGAAGPDDVRRSIQASRELTEYFAAIAAERRREPRDDLLSALLMAEEQGDKLSLDEVYATCILLLVAGNETTTNLIGNAVLALLSHPDQLALLREDPARIEGAIEEALRWNSPVQATSRIATEDLEIAGQRVRKGEQVILQLGAANRDPAQFPDPDRFDVLRRDSRQHLSFSLGIHHCLGAALARQEAQVAVGRLVARFPELRLATDEPEWTRNTILRGPRSVPLALA